MSTNSRPGRRRLGRTTAAVGLAMLGLAAAPATANAATTTNAATNAGATTNAAVAHPISGVNTHALLNGTTAAAGAAVDRFWTQKRLKAAKSLDSTEVPGPLPTAAQMRAAATPVSPADGTPTVLPPSEGLAAVGVTSTVGRVFFNDPSGALDSCSGSSVTSQAGDMVLTAGHCVFGGPQFDNSGNQPRNWYYNWIYIPGYWVDSAGYVHEPYGVWAAWAIASTSPWINNRDLTQDIGMALMVHNAAGQALTTAVGGQGLTWDLPVGQWVNAYGYPVNPSNPSAPVSMQSCGDVLQRVGGTGPQGDIRCGMGPGASGGPWLAYQNIWGMGLVGGVNSYIVANPDPTDPRPYIMFGPWFSQNVYNMYVSLATV